MLTLDRSILGGQKRTCFTALLALTIGFGVAGQAHAQSSGAPAKPWSAIIAAAEKEGVVTVYSAAPTAITQQFANGFKKIYPKISVDVLRAGSGSLTPKVEQERLGGADGADVLITTDLSYLLSQADAHHLAKPIGPSAAAWPAAYLRAGVLPIGGVEPITITYNTKLVKNPPKSYADLTSPEFKGKLGLVDPASSPTIAVWYDWVEKQQGPDYLAKLKAQDPKIYASEAAASQAVASGEVLVGDFSNASALTLLISQGAPIAYTLPNPSLGFQYGIGLLGWSKRPEAAQLFVDYLTSRTGQQNWHNSHGSASPLDGIEGSLDIKTIAVWNSADYPPDVIKKYDDHWNAVIRK